MQDLLNFLAEHGCADFHPIIDDKIHRFDLSGPKTGWFVGHQVGEYTYATFGDWREGTKYEFKPEKGCTKEINEEIKKRQAENKRQQEEEQERVSIASYKKWEASPTNEKSEYLTKKQVDGYGCRYSHSSWGSIDLLVPCKDITGKLWGVQKIQEDGSKFFTPGQRIKGCFHQIGDISKTLYLAEGIATACSIYQATKIATVCCFNAGNLEPVAKAFREKYPNLKIIICGDDDRFTQVQGKPKNPGRDAAQKAAFAVLPNSTFILPKFKDPKNVGTDFNDIHVSEGLEEVARQLANPAKQEEPKPVDEIKTKNTGFHFTEDLANGKKKYTPDYGGLRQHFDNLNPYKIMGESGLIFTWRGTHYEEYHRDYLNGFAQQHFFPPADTHKRTEFKNLILCTNFVKTDWFDKTTMGMTNFKNGVLNNTTLEFGPHDPKYGFKYVLGYNYEPEAKCPLFDKFMNDITCADKSLELNLLEYMGYALSNDDYWLQSALILEGQGSNGKSTLIKILRELAGSDNSTAYTLTDLAKETNRPGIDGKLFNIAEETPSRSMQDSSLFKNLTGDGKVIGRKLYANSYSFLNRTKIIFACNEMPESPDTTHGYFRRLFIIPFRAVFTRGNPNFDAKIFYKIKPEMPGIFNKCFAAYKEVIKRGDFASSEARENILNQYQADSDYTTTWIKENMQFHPMGNGMDNMKQPIATVHLAYTQDMENHGFKALDRNKFGRKIAAITPDYKSRKTRDTSGKTRGYLLIATTRDSGENF